MPRPRSNRRRVTAAGEKSSIIKVRRCDGSANDALGRQGRTRSRNRTTYKRNDEEKKRRIQEMQS
jgi:hypothetical protein